MVKAEQSRGRNRRNKVRKKETRRWEFRDEEEEEERRERGGGGGKKKKNKLKIHTSSKGSREM